MREIKSVRDWVGVDDPMCEIIVDKKYLASADVMGEKEEVYEMLKRISMNDIDYYPLIVDCYFIPAGRIIANLGLWNYGIKVTMSNCYVLEGPEDNIESIYEVAKQMARTFSYGGGVGIDISKLAPKNAKVRNSAVKTTGAVSFCETFSNVSTSIGQAGRRGALMICINDDHPDLEEFITHKSDLELTTGANMSVKMSDAFFKQLAIRMNNQNEIFDSNREGWKLQFHRPETNETIEKIVDPLEIMKLIAKTAWNYGEPGILYWDTINDYCLLGKDPDFRFDATNPCGEEPLPAGGACVLGALNLSKYVTKENIQVDEDHFALFQDEREILDIDQEAIYTPEINRYYFKEETLKKFEHDIYIAIRYLDDILTLNSNLHPLQIQRDASTKYRAIGLGIMGLADAFINCEIGYGSVESLILSDYLGSIMAFNAIETSCELARKRGKFDTCIPEYIIESDYFIENVNNNKYIDEDRIHALIEKVKKYGLRNAQLLTVAPTGTTSTILNVSGGIEPIFSNHYTRVTKTIDENGDKSFEVYPEVVKDYAKKYPEVYNEDGIIDIEKLPYYFMTSKEVNYRDKIRVQAAWQRHIDSSISSTVNLPEYTTEEEVMDLYIYAHKKGLKGITVFREGCKRAGILYDKSKSRKEEKSVKPEKEEKQNTGSIIDPKTIKNGNIGYNPIALVDRRVFKDASIDKDATKIDFSKLEKPIIIQPGQRVKDFYDKISIPSDAIKTDTITIKTPKIKKNQEGLITREQLGKRLDAAVYYASIACGHIYIVISRDENDNLVEAFMASSKSGGCSANAECLGRYASACMRNGMSIDTIVDITKGVKCPACLNLKGKGQALDGLSCGDALARIIKEEEEYVEKYIRSSKAKLKKNDDSESMVDIIKRNDALDAQIYALNILADMNKEDTDKKINKHLNSSDENTKTSLKGTVSDFKITDKELSPEEIYNEYKKNYNDTKDIENLEKLSGIKSSKKKSEDKYDFTQYSDDENIQNGVCPECGTSLLRSEGCLKCMNCWFSKC
ncbi:MAG: adenosylcobalamin-dependent ribonucleoside-diphosphate reductase [Candidatus Izemoplasmatales bacterium]|nr:adenosylcobalamin-dependent ribonucleoside-diphosphate reductase [Candidatus Izemoplasmatales bacterium]